MLKIFRKTNVSCLCYALVLMLLLTNSWAQQVKRTDISQLQTGNKNENQPQSIPTGYKYNVDKHVKTYEEIPGHISDDIVLANNAQIKKSLALRARYKRTLKPLKATIAIVIDDVGVDQKDSRTAVSLEGVYTLSFLTYGTHLQKLTKTAYDNGHEIFIHQGAEPISSKADPGPNALRIAMDKEEIRLQINRAVKAVPYAKGLNTHMGSYFNQWLDGVSIMVDHIYNNNLIYLDSFTHKSSQAFYQAFSRKYPALGRDVFLDGDNSDDAIIVQLERTRKIADKDGFAIAIGHPYKTTMGLLPEWQKKLGEEGYQFVTISQLWQALSGNDVAPLKNKEADTLKKEKNSKYKNLQEEDGR